MDASNIPTDNLYKFLAIAGLVLIIFAGTFANNRRIEIDREILSVEIKAQELTARSEFTTESQSDLIKDGEDLKKDASEFVRKAPSFYKVHLMESTIDNLLSDLERFEKKYETIREKSLEYKLKSIEVNGQLKYVEQLQRELKEAKILLYLSFYMGFELSIFGFYSWYHRVQMYQDILLEKQISKDAVVLNRKKFKYHLLLGFLGFLLVILWQVITSYFF